MTEPKVMQDVHAIRERMSREIKGMTIAEQNAYWARQSKENEAHLFQMGYKFVPSESGIPGAMRLVRV